MNVGGQVTAERDELVRLRREVRQLRVEREILSKAAAWFAREAEVGAAKTMIERTEERFGLKPERLVGDTA